MRSMAGNLPGPKLYRQIPDRTLPCAATLLIAADNLLPVLDANETANALLTCKIIPGLISGTTQLLEDQVVLEKVGALIQDWFQHHLTPSPAGVIKEGAGARGTATQASNPRGWEFASNRCGRGALSGSDHIQRHTPEMCGRSRVKLQCHRLPK